MPDEYIDEQDLKHSDRTLGWIAKRKTKYDVYIYRNERSSSGDVRLELPPEIHFSTIKARDSSMFDQVQFVSYVFDSVISAS